MTQPFEDVRFPIQHPTSPVAEHEVLMSFNSDDDALMFRDWWQLWGKHLFGAYAAPIGKPTRHRVPGRKEMYAALKARSEELQTKWYADD